MSEYVTAAELAPRVMTLEQAQALFPGKEPPSPRWLSKEAKRLGCGRRIGKSFYIYDGDEFIKRCRADQDLSSDKIRQIVKDDNSHTAIGWIYFLRCGDFVKVGFAVDVQRRVKCLQIGNPLDLVLLGTISGSISAEAAIHDLLKERRHRYEWFHLAPDLLKVIEDVCSCP